MTLSSHGDHVLRSVNAHGRDARSDQLRDHRSRPATDIHDS
jgi:hypothetical protein